MQEVKNRRQTNDFYPSLIRYDSNQFQSRALLVVTRINVYSLNKNKGRNEELEDKEALIFPSLLLSSMQSLPGKDTLQSQKK
jgi:hypothetical protein